MGVHGLLSYALGRVEEQGRGSWRSLRGACLIADGHSVAHWIAEEALEEDYVAWAGGFERFYQHGKQVLEAFNAAGVTLTFAFDRKLGAEADAFKDDTDMDRALQQRDQLVAVQEELLGRAPQGKRKFKRPPLPPLMVTQFKRLLRELGLEVLPVVGEADAFIAKQVASPSSPFTAVLSRDSDFLVYRDCAMLPPDLLDLHSMTGRVVRSSEVAEWLGLPQDLLPELAVLQGCDYTKKLSSRVALARSLGLSEAPRVEEVAHVLSRKGPREHALIERFLGEPSHRALLEAWVHTLETYSLESEADDGVRQASEALGSRGLPAFLVEAVINGRLSRWLMGAAGSGRNWRAPIMFERLPGRWEQGVRPPAVALTRRLRRIGYSLVGAAQVVEEAMLADDCESSVVTAGESLIAEWAPEVDQGHWKATLASLLSEGPSLSKPLPLLTSLVFNALSSGATTQPPLPPSDDDRLPPHLSLVALALRAMLLASAADIPDRSQRLSERQLRALVATVARCSEGNHNQDQAIAAGAGAGGPLVLEAASLCTWALFTFVTLRDLAILLGCDPEAGPSVEPRAWMDAHVLLQELLLLQGGEGAQVPPGDGPGLARRLWSFATSGVDLSQALGPQRAPMQAQATPPALPALDVERLHAHDEDDEEEEVLEARVTATALEWVDEEAQEPAPPTGPPAPALPLPPLPILEKKDDILSAVTQHRVVVIEGETGCGKSTMVPQFIVKADPLARVAVTTPTRKAATNLAREVARQMQDAGSVGYRIGNERSSEKGHAKILYVTAGWLLQRLVHLRPGEVSGFTHVILDEVHERSVESDLLCFLLRESLYGNRARQAASSLRLILMSATLESSIFIDYFTPAHRQATVPRLHVGARSPFKVTEVYLEELRDFCPPLRSDLPLSTWIDSMSRRGAQHNKPGLDDKMMAVAVRVLSHVVEKGEVALVFVSGMADIEDMHTLLMEVHKELDVVAFHSLISTDEQEKVFELSPDKPKIILATNIAEASLTIRNVKYVLDFGVSKTLRYEAKEHRTVLAYTWVSKAAANQRRGRTGRVCNGFCVRLYTRAFFESLPEHEDPEMAIRPLDSVLLQMKLMGFSEISGALQRCLTPPEEEQVVSAAAYLHELGALEGADVESRMTPMAPLLSALGLDLPVARFLILGVVLGVATEAIVIAASFCLPQDVFLLPHPTFHSSVADHLASVIHVQYHKEAYSHQLGSDPLATLLAYGHYLRGPKASGANKRKWARNRGVLSRVMDRLQQVVKELCRKLASHAEAVPTFQEIEEEVRTRAYAARLVGDEDRLFIIRAALLGAFYGNLLRGDAVSRGTAEVDSRTLVVKKPPDFLRGGGGRSVRSALGLQEDLVASVGMSKNRRDLEVMFRDVMVAVDDDDEEHEEETSDDLALCAALDPKHTLQDVHFAVKGLLNAKQVSGLSVEREGPADDEQQGRRGKLVELNVMGRYATVWVCLKTGQRVSFQKASLLRNAASTASPHALFAVCPEVTKYLNKDQMPFYSAARATFLPFPPSLLCVIVAAFARAELVRFRRLSDVLPPEIAAVLREAGVWVPSSEEYFGVRIGGGEGWLQAPCRLRLGVVHTLNDIRRGISSSISGTGRLAVSRPAIRALLGLARVCWLGAETQTHLLHSLPHTDDALHDDADAARRADMLPPLAAMEGTAISRPLPPPEGRREERPQEPLPWERKRAPGTPAWARPAPAPSATAAPAPAHHAPKPALQPEGAPKQPKPAATAAASERERSPEPSRDYNRALFFVRSQPEQWASKRDVLKYLGRSGDPEAWGGLRASSASEQLLVGHQSAWMQSDPLLRSLGGYDATPLDASLPPHARALLHCLDMVLRAPCAVTGQDACAGAEALYTCLHRSRPLPEVWRRLFRDLPGDVLEVVGGRGADALGQWIDKLDIPCLRVEDGKLALGVWPV